MTKPKRTYQPEPWVEINLETFKKSVREGLHTYFTPVRVLFRILAWPFRRMARPQNQTPARKEASLRPQR